MNLKELSTQLQGKRRTVADLARFISTRTDHNPNYTLLLGAGCSISSGIRSAHELIKEWRNELCLEISDVDEQRTYLKQNYGDWYDPNREYSSLFERKFDLQRQRRMFVEKEVASKTPSLGYAYESDKNEREKKLNHLITKLSEQDPDSFVVLTMRSELFPDNKNKSALDELLTRIDEVMRRNPHSSNLELHGVRLKVLTLINDEERLKSAIDEIEALPDSLYDSEISSQIANLKRQKFGLDEDAIVRLNASLQSEDPIIIKLLFNTLLDLNRIDEAEKLLNQWNHKLSPESKSDAKISLLDAKKDYDQALSETQKLGLLTGINSNANVLYYLLKKGKYREAEQLGKDILTPINYCLDAEAEIINYELACKKLKQNFNKSRLEKLLEFTKSPDVKAAINAVLDKKAPMIDNIKIVMEKDKTFRFLAERWPAFDDYRKDPDFIKAFSI